MVGMKTFPRPKSHTPKQRRETSKGRFFGPCRKSDRAPAEGRRRWGTWYWCAEQQGLTFNLNSTESLRCTSFVFPAAGADFCHSTENRTAPYLQTKFAWEKRSEFHAIHLFTWCIISVGYPAFFYEMGIAFLSGGLHEIMYWQNLARCLEHSRK